MSLDESITHLWPGEKEQSSEQYQKHKNNVIVLKVAVRATEVLDLKVPKVKKCGTARRSVMIGGLCSLSTTQRIRPYSLALDIDSIFVNLNNRNV